MGQLTDMINADFDRRIEIAKKLGVPVHGKFMLKLQAAEKVSKIKIDPKDIKKQNEDPTSTATE